MKSLLTSISNIQLKRDSAFIITDPNKSLIIQLKNQVHLKPLLTISMLMVATLAEQQWPHLSSAFVIPVILQMATAASIWSRNLHCFVCLFGSASFLPSFLEILCLFLGTSATAFADFETKSPSSVTKSCTFPLRSFSGPPSGAGALPGTLNFLKAAAGGFTLITAPFFVRLFATVIFPNVFIWL